MGIPGLTNELKPAKEVRTFNEFALTEGFQHNQYSDKTAHIGIDASIWLNQAQAISQTMGGPGTQAGENPALRILFFRLCSLLSLSVTPIFVFDGESRPSIKRGKSVRSGNRHWMAAYLERMIDAFGFCCYTAPGEAEAELAVLTRKGLIQAAITTDTDLLVFGGTCMIQTPNVKRDGDRITIYTSGAIRNHPDVTLSQAGLFLVAILCGADYDLNGLKGCGVKTACQLARGELSQSLFTATTELSPSALSDFLVGWRKNLQEELSSDPHGLMGRKRPTLAMNVTNTFPDVNVLRYHALPVTSWSENGNGPDTSLWTLHQPDLVKIATLCEKSFSWGTSHTIISRFHKSVWSGVTIRYLLKSLQLVNQNLDDPLASCASGSGIQDSFSDASLLYIRQGKVGPHGPATGANVDGYCVEIATYVLARDAVSALNADIREAVLQAPRPAKYVWIPAAILEQAIPKLVDSFHAQKQKRTRDHTTPHQPSLQMPPDNHVAGSTTICSSSHNGTGIEENPIVIDKEAERNVEPVASSSRNAHAASSSSRNTRSAAAGTAENPLTVDESGCSKLEDGTIFLGFIDLS